MNLCKTLDIASEEIGGHDSCKAKIMLVFLHVLPNRARRIYCIYGNFELRHYPLKICHIHNVCKIC